jgi:hypothetical protein
VAKEKWKLDTGCSVENVRDSEPFNFSGYLYHKQLEIITAAEGWCRTNKKSRTRLVLLQGFPKLLEGVDKLVAGA